MEFDFFDTESYKNRVMLFMRLILVLNCVQWAVKSKPTNNECDFEPRDSLN